MDKSATELVDRLYEEVAAAVKANGFKPRYFDPEFSDLSKVTQITEIIREMRQSDKQELNAEGKKLLDHVYSEVANAAKARNLKASPADPTFSVRSKSAQASLLLRLLLADSQGC